MENIAEGAERLISLSKDFEEELRTISHSLEELQEGTFEKLLEIVGDMHDPVVSDVSAHLRYANDLLKDYTKAMMGAKRLIGGKGQALRKLGSTSYE